MEMLIKNDLRSGQPTVIEFAKYGKMIGYAEVSKEENWVGTPKPPYLLEVRYIELSEEYRYKRYFREVVDELLSLGYPLTGTIEENSYDERSIWEHLGANFYNDFEFTLEK